MCIRDSNLVDQPVKEMFEHDLVDLKTFFMKLTTYYGVKMCIRDRRRILLDLSYVSLQCSFIC